MLADQDRLTYLFRKYLRDEDSREEMEELFAYIREAKERAPLEAEIKEVFRQVGQQEGFEEVDWDAMFSRIVHVAGGEPKKPKTQINSVYLWRSAAAAAILVVLAGVGLRWYLHRDSSSPQVAQSENTLNDVMPGGNKAILTLANGTRIVLDSMDNGQLTSQGNANVVKVNAGVLAYKMQRGKKTKDHIAYNILTTPRGGQYNLILPDGTKVWLNAASSIRYPAVFIGKERIVEVTGEAYFEVVENAAMPFIVQRGDMRIQVLGTHFNVNAYSDEDVEAVTLLEGLIKVSELSTHHSLVVRPEQQVQLNKGGQMSLAKHVNVGDAVAWKNGFFSFHNDNLQSVMRKIARWYDVDVIYRTGVNNEQQFSGKIDRNLTLSQVLSGLEQTRAHFKIEANRKVEILP